MTTNLYFKNIIPLNKSLVYAIEMCATQTRCLKFVLRWHTLSNQWVRLQIVTNQNTHAFNFGIFVVVWQSMLEKTKNACGASQVEKQQMAVAEPAANPKCNHAIDRHSIYHLICTLHKLSFFSLPLLLIVYVKACIDMWDMCYSVYCSRICITNAMQWFSSLHGFFSNGTVSFFAYITVGFLSVSSKWCQGFLCAYCIKHIGVEFTSSEGMMGPSATSSNSTRTQLVTLFGLHIYYA